MRSNSANSLSPQPLVTLSVVEGRACRRASKVEGRRDDTEPSSVLICFVTPQPSLRSRHPERSRRVKGEGRRATGDPEAKTPQCHPERSRRAKGERRDTEAKARRRCRDWTGATYVRGCLIWSRHSPDHKREIAVAKAIVVRKSAARKGVRVRLPAIPKQCHPER